MLCNISYRHRCVASCFISFYDVQSDSHYVASTELNIKHEARTARDLEQSDLPDRDTVLGFSWAK